MKLSLISIAILVSFMFTFYNTAEAAPANIGNCPKPTVNYWAGGYQIIWVEDAVDGGKDATGIMFGFSNFDGKMSNLKLDCDAKTVTVDLDAPTTQIEGELYVMENSRKIPYIANSIVRSISITGDDRDYDHQIIPAQSSYNTGFSFFSIE